MTSICILGSTGSVGVQSLEVARSLGLKVSGLSAYSEVELLAEQARQFGPAMVGIGDVRAEARARALFSRMSTPPELFFGPEGVSQVAAAAEHDLVVNAIVGFAGVWPTLAAIDAGHDVALANKETLVAAGSVVMDRARQEGVAIRPIDSEHSAIYQCIQGQGREAVARIILTASGGPFIDRYDFADISVAEAISHP
ncbi:MAG TPA: 1-deoxy-D-xylulose-5-phosphate reductoisomerase, partial [Firmicutes bacterium]|nr:1-deoxy-D-xylulose-5-phosphate reductoisomerase [Bacillota bacterium]